jgi:hypothetical protein
MGAMYPLLLLKPGTVYTSANFNELIKHYTSQSNCNMASFPQLANALYFIATTSLPLHLYQTLSLQFHLQTSELGNELLILLQSLRI